MSKNDQLKNSEKKLTHSFVLWAFLFLICFEILFLGMRYLTEKYDQEEKFLQITNALISQPQRQLRGEMPQGLGISTLKTTLEGEIIFSQNNFLGISQVADLLDEDILEELQEHPNEIIYEDGIMLRQSKGKDSVVYYFARASENLDKVWRDILRFLIIDLIVLIPLYFLLRLHIRKILTPVKENLDMMTHFVHDAGHELKTPIAIISGNLQIMRDSDEVEFDLIEGSLETIDHMNDSIQGLLELADLRLPEKDTHTNLTEIIENELIKANNFRDVVFENEISEKFLVHASEKHLSILMRNLIENAIKYNKDEGNVRIYREKNSLFVADSGIGMSDEDVKRIFDRFYRANQGSGIGGSGIGLTLVDKIIKLYDWNIEVKSKLDEGTTFIITFQ